MHYPGLKNVWLYSRKVKFGWQEHWVGLFVFVPVLYVTFEHIAWQCLLVSIH